MYKWRRVSAAGLLTLIIVFELSAFSLLAFRNSTLDYSALAFGAILVAMLLFQYISLTAIFRRVYGSSRGRPSPPGGASSRWSSS